MKKRLGFVALLIGLSFVSLGAAETKPVPAKLKPKDLPAQFRKWLEEDVVYIISPREKDVFLRLENDRQRSIFIENFWKVRDPNPSTPENEFKTEHYRRINYVNKNFGKESPGPAWRSDMGRIYIILGEPKSIDKFENLTQVYPMIIWFYEGERESGRGLPGAFNVVFYKKDGIGEYQLYSPIRDGPQKLLPLYSGDMTDYQDAVQQLYNVEPAIADVSLSLIPGESQALFSPSISSDLLLSQTIPASSYASVQDSYAEKLLAYKDFVEVDYTANYINSDYLVSVFENPSGNFYVHYLLEPSRLTLEKIDNRYQSNLEINGRLMDEQGQTVYQFDRSVPILLNEDQMANIKAKLFSFQDMFPVIPGRYKLSLLFKNSVSKEFATVDVGLTVGRGPGLAITPPLLASRVDRESKYRDQNKPFLLDGVQIVPSPRNDFLAQDRLFVFSQIQGLTDDIRRDGSIACEVLREKDASQVRSAVLNLRDFPQRQDFLQEFSLADLSPADYTVKVSVRDAKGTALATAQAHFYIAIVPVLARPWVMSLPKPGDDDPETTHIQGLQHLNVNDVPEAHRLLEIAFRKDPENAEFGLDYCRVLFKIGDFSTIKTIARSFLDRKRTDFLQVQGQACQALSQWGEAIENYKAYLMSYGTNIHILNAIGECYSRLGDTAEALQAWQKSLELDPKQDKIRALVKALQDKK